jgi:hypothetical protein
LSWWRLPTDTVTTVALADLTAIAIDAVLICPAGRSDPLR